MAEKRDELVSAIQAEYGLTLTFEEVAKIAKCSKTTARRAFWRGELIGSRFQRGGPIRFTAGAVADWLIGGEERAY